MTLHTERLKPMSAGRPKCEGGAHETGTGRGDVGTHRVATYRAVIIGHDVPLCDQCKKEWVEAWDGALNVEELAA